MDNAVVVEADDNDVRGVVVLRTGEVINGGGALKPFAPIDVVSPFE